MPKLWAQTIQTHRQEVGDAILDTTAALVAEHGLRAVTMSQIAEQTGIGRATLYKYFPDVEAILLAWHERHVAGHLSELAALRDQADDAGQALDAVLSAYALLMHDRAKQTGGTDLSALVHQDKHVSQIDKQLRRLLQDLLAEASRTGHVRTDIAPEELASYCIHALSAAANAPSKASVQRLVNVIFTGLRSEDAPGSPLCP